MDNDTTIKAYKGFNRDMTCRGFQFREGETYELPEGQTANVCERGFHACENPLDCFRYYPPTTSVYHVVEQSGGLSRHDEDTKVASSRITIGARLDVAGIVRASVEYVRAKIAAARDRKEGGYGASLAGGDGASLAGGDKASLAGGYGASLAGGYRASLAGGYGASLAGGYKASLAGGDGASLAGDDGASLAGGYSASLAGGDGASLAGGYGASLAGGDSASLAGGYSASLAGGDWAVAACRGQASVGAGGAAIVRGNGVRAKGGLGAVLVIVEEDSDSYNINHHATIVIDGKRYQPNTWYGLDESGNVVEAKEGGDE